MKNIWLIFIFFLAVGCSQSEDTTEAPEAPKETGPTIAEDLQPLSILLNADKPLIGISALNRNTFPVNLSNIETVSDDSKELNSLILPSFSGTVNSTNFTNFEGIATTNPTIVQDTDGYMIDLAITAELPLGAQGKCFGLLSWQGILPEETCSSVLNSYVFSFSSLQVQSEDLRVNVYAANGETDDFLVSTAIDSYRIRYKQISDIDLASDAISNLFTHNSTLYFTSSSSTQEKLYKYENSFFNRVSNLNTSGDDNIRSMVSNTTGLYFIADGPMLTKIYKYSGATGSGITQVSSLNNFGGDTISSNLVSLNEKIYFASPDNPEGEDRLMVYDGLTIDAIEYNIAGAEVDEIDELYALNNYVYMYAKDDTGFKKLWRYDPNFNNGLGRIEKILNLYPNHDDGVKYLQDLNNFLYFVGTNNSGREKLFKLDPVNKVAKQLSSVNLIGSDNILEMKILAGKIFMSARNTDGWQKLFMYDPSVGKFFQLTNFFNGNENPANFTSYGDFIYFVATVNSQGHRKMFLYDVESNSIIQVADLNQNQSDEIDNLHAVESVLYFTGQEEAGKDKLYRLCDESLGCFN